MNLVINCAKEFGWAWVGALNLKSRFTKQPVGQSAAPSLAIKILPLSQLLYASFTITIRLSTMWLRRFAMLHQADRYYLK